MLFCLCGFHMLQLHIQDWVLLTCCMLSLTLGVAGWRVRFRRPSVLADCDVVVCMCFDHDSFESIVVPS